MPEKKIIVQKFGGTSVATPRKIVEAAKKVVRTKKAGFDVVCIVSALGNTTDELIKLAYKINPLPSEREMDMLMSTGEQVSSALFTMAIHRLGYDAISFTGSQVGIITDYFHTKARILRVDTKRVKEELGKGKIVVVAGFQGITKGQDITTLGRGGSNMTAVALASALGSRICEIYTDVDGIFTADPHIVSEARKLSSLSYEETLEMTSLGAQVLQPEVIALAKRKGVPIHVRSSFKEEDGTVISREVKAMKDIMVTGVTVNANEAKVTIPNVPDRPGTAARLFKEIAKANVNVDMILQNVSSQGRTDMSFTVPEEELNKALSAVSKVCRTISAGQPIFDRNIAKVSAVGLGMRTHTGIAAKMFNTLAREKINIEMISTSEIKISCVIRKRHAKKAVMTLHKVFKLKKGE